MLTCLTVAIIIIIMMRRASLLVGLVCLSGLLTSLPSVQADIYLHTFRGSNNRLAEEGRERHNANRMFDSQNNNRGGYNVGSTYYYTGSTLMLEWTEQHSCGDKTRMNCELILQYTCDDRLRDGTTTATIPTNPNECYNYDCDTDVRFGRHESYESYQRCRFTQRNKGLFTSSQDLRGNSQRFTRQNPGGTRRGYECPEERDYYPYWQPTIWRDIAVLTNDPTRCAAYQAESQNVKAKNYCDIPKALWDLRAKQSREAWIPIEATECEKLHIYDEAANATLYAKWVSQPAWGLPPPECRENQWSRDNHHGNVDGSNGFMASYNWTIPADLIHERCAFRLRYNISTGDTIEWENDVSVQAGVNGTAKANAKANWGRVQANRDPAWVPIWKQYDLSFDDVADSFKGLAATNTAGLRLSREYVLKNNPRIDIFGDLLSSAARGSIKTQLAINTAQFGRTFQDRSHRFAIRKRPTHIPTEDKIQNIGVRGKRGNIVQVYPGVEYDFTPNRVQLTTGEWLHFQWTGSNTNPRNNAGQGLAGTDRSNVVALREKSFDDHQQSTWPATKGGWGNSYPSRIDDSIPFLGLSPADQAYLATLQSLDGIVGLGGQFGGHMDEMDDAGTYFDLGPRKITQSGIYHYYSTRNHAFSNREQKGKIVVSSVKAETDLIGWNGGMLTTAGGQSVQVAQNAFKSIQQVTIAVTPRDAPPATTISDQRSDFMTVEFDPNALTSESAGVLVTMNYDQSPLHEYTMLRASSLTSDDWTSVSAQFSGGQATTSTRQPGVFTVRGELDGGAVAGIVIGCLAFIAIVSGAVYWVYKKKGGFSGFHMRGTIAKAKAKLGMGMTSPVPASTGPTPASPSGSRV